MRITKTKGRLMVLIAVQSLTGCGSVMTFGAGCETYAEARRDLPIDALAEAPVEIAGWVDSTDVAMLEACRK